MKYGPTPTNKLPEQDQTKVMLLAERHQRASWAHNKWAEGAKVAVDFFEGRQWTAKALADMAAQKRPALTFNVIAPLVRLILGYQANNKTDIEYKPGSDSRSSDEIAEVLSRLEKSVAIGCGLKFVDGEVFLDGIVAGRGFYKTVLDFEKNDLGEISTTAQDPFATYIDPDCDTYDLNDSAAFIQTAKMVSIDEIEGTFGKAVAGLVRPFTQGATPVAPVTSMMVGDEVTPVRTFGQRDENANEWWDSFYGTMGDFVDTYRKTIKIIQSEHRVSEARNVCIDLETGDKKVLPTDWGKDRIEKIIYYGQSVGNPLIVERRQVTRLQCTTMVGDMLLHDKPSPYDTYSIAGYFPYFRRGMTRGAVEDLIDPQKEKNKRRSVEVEVTSKLSNGGWSYHESSLDPVQERKLKNFGASPGFMMKWKGDHEPHQMAPAAPAMAHERLEQKAQDDIRTISGINESALGEIDRVQSGRAIEARQRQAVIAIQLYMDNFSRSKTILGGKHLECFQNHYTEKRMYRVLGEDGKFTQILINEMQMDPASGIKRILNDITVGKYSAIVDEQPLSATFANAQFEEMMTLLEKMGPAIGPALPAFADLIVDMSSLPRKSEWIERFKALQGMQPPGAPGAPPPGPPGAPPPPQLPPPAAPAAG
ncbi:hypothetical protein NKH48_03265 [Mesorhizobium sp. M1233]|uniref:portal protein n=1 Tax=Mesorhizobium sp. M1233 TaxID=2957072 RepID=UPI003339ED96